MAGTMWLGGLPVGAAAQSAEELLDRARDHHRAGRWERALDVYRLAAEAAEPGADGEPGDPTTAGIAYNNRCYLLMEQAEYRAALEDCERALALRRPLGEGLRLARTLNNLGLALQHLGRYEEARQRFQEALDLNRSEGDVAGEVLNQSNLGVLAIAVGDYERALWHLAEAESRSREHVDEPWAAGQIRLVRLNRGVVFEKLGAYREALQLYLEMADESERMDPGHRAALKVNLGVLYRNLGDPVTAIASFEEAAEIFRELGDEAALSNALLNLALARHLNLGELETAEADYRKALELARRSGDRSEETQDLFYLGELLLEQERLTEARLMFSRGLEVAEASGSAEGRWSALRGLGETAFAAGRLEEALEHLRQAIEEIERVRASIRQQARRAGYFGDKRPVYGTAVAVLAELNRRQPDAGYAEQALEMVQRAKARELMEAMARHDPEPANGDVADPGEAGGDAGERGTRRSRMQPLGVAELQRRSGDTRVMELFLARDRLFAWIIDREGLVMRDLGPAAPLLQRASQIHRDLASGREPSSTAVGELSRALVEVPGLLDGDPRHVQVAPDGRLFYLPFEILEDPVSGSSLVERTALSYLPSASLLPPVGRQRSATTARFLGFGNPKLPAPGTEASSSAGLLAARFHLQPLPAAERELEMVARRLRGERRIHLGEDATEEAFRQEVQKGARVVHLATHTLVDERLDGVAGSGAAVLLTPSDGDNGMLTPAEIAALDARVDLTVLASCSSALGSVVDGHALASLTGSLLAAGSSAVIATLWDVEDSAAEVFMEQLYHDLGKGLAPAEALRAAKRRLRTHPVWGRPHLWAGYVLVGEAPPVTERSFLAVWGWALMVGLGTALLAALWIRRRQATAGPLALPQGQDW